VIWNVVLVTGTLITFGSSGWALKKFFVIPKQGLPKWMRALEILGTLGVLANLWVLGTTPMEAPHALAGFLLFAFSSSIFWWAHGTNRSRPLNIAFTEAEPSHFVSAGPYRYVRHPFYLSYIVGWIAGPVASQNWWLLLPAVVLTTVYFKAARMEERYFSQSAHAEKYLAYRNRTGMFLPRLFPR